MYFKYLKNHIITYHNIISLLIFFLVSLAMMFTISISTTIFSLKNYLYDYNIDLRTLIVDGDNDKFAKLKEIEHVTTVEDTIYEGGIQTAVSEFDQDLKGSIILKPLLDQSNIFITKGSMIKGENEAICGSIFYPYEIEKDNDKIIFNKERLLKSEDIIGKKFKVTSFDDESITLDFKIVGTYDSSKNNTDLSTCYILKSDYKTLSPKYNGGVSSFDEEKQEMVFIPTPYTGKLVIIDKYQNVNAAKEAIQKLGLSVMNVSEFNPYLVGFLTYGLLALSLFLLFIFSLILGSFLSKKIKNKGKNNAILKALGYDMETIKSLDLMENIVLFSISFIISLILYVLIFNYLKYQTLAEYIYDGTIISFSFVPIVISFILIILVLIFTNKKILNKQLEKNISEILS